MENSTGALLYVSSPFSNPPIIVYCRRSDIVLSLIVRSPIFRAAAHWCTASTRDLDGRYHFPSPVWNALPRNAENCALAARTAGRNGVICRFQDFRAHPVCRLQSKSNYTPMVFFASPTFLKKLSFFLNKFLTNGVHFWYISFCPLRVIYMAA